MLQACPFGRRAKTLYPESLTNDEKTWLGRQLVDRSTTPKKLSEKYGLTLNYVNILRVAVRDNSPFPGKRGRPTTFTEEAKNKVVKFLDGDVHQIRRQKFVDYSKTMMHESASSRGKILADLETPSKRTLKRLEDSLGINDGNAEITTNARAEACSSVRNAVSFAVMNAVMVPKTHAALMLNPDGTTMTVGIDPSGMVKVVYQGPRPKAMKVLPMPGEGGLLYSIKFYLLINAMGDQCDPIYVIQDKAMGEEDIEVHKVPGLGLGTAMEFGYVVFCKSRCGNLAFFKWFLKDILIPWIERLKAHYEIDESEFAWMQMDGEPIQLECLSHDDILEILESARIAIGKLCASTTEVQQPCDMECFKGPKTCLKSINEGEVWDNKVMLDKLGWVIRRHFDKMSLNCTPSALSSSNKRQCATGLLRIQLAFMQSLRRDTIQKSFRTTGIYPFSLKTIIANCKRDVSLEEYTHIESVMEQLKAIMRCKGELLDSDFDAAGIRNVLEKRKDHLVVYRRRAVLLTHKYYIREVSRKIASKEESKIAKAASKEEDKANKAKAKAEKDALRAAALLVRENNKAAKAKAKADKAALKAEGIALRAQVQSYNSRV